MTATRRGTFRLTLGALVLILLAAPRVALTLSLDDRSEMRLGLRAYTAARIGTEKIGGEGDPLSFPRSAPGHLRQHRYFLELKFDHDIKRLATTGHGAARLLGWFDPSVLKYSLQYRGEGEGIYDYGPSEYTDSFAKQKAAPLQFPNVSLPGLIESSSVPPSRYVHDRVKRLREIARQRHRFFLGYLDVEKGPVFVRVGRQIIAWGETDNFRLLDNINPIDQGFGGFLIALDERRVPVDALKASYQFGTIGPIDNAFLEGFGALGNRISTNPGIPFGSPWTPGGLGYPNPPLEPVIVVPDKEDFRGGGRFVFNHRDVTYTLAHYWTYFDTPGVVFRIPVGFPQYPRTIKAIQKVPRVPITGASLTFPVPSWYAVVRSEAAYFHNEPFNRQGRGSSADSFFGPGTPQYARLRRQNNTEGGLNPFVYPGFLNVVPEPLNMQPHGPRTTPIRGHILQRDSFNYAVGLDLNRFVRWLNPGQTILISTQFFYKHVFDSPGDLVLPVVARNSAVDRRLPIIGKAPAGQNFLLGFGCPVPTPPGEKVHNCRLQPRLIGLNDDQFLHTLLVTTSYRGGRIVPSFGLFYDWMGATLFQPGVAYVRDPFRFVFDYTRIEAPLGAGQISALRDRDNVRFQVEYVF